MMGYLQHALAEFVSTERETERGALHKREYGYGPEYQPRSPSVFTRYALLGWLLAWNLNGSFHRPNLPDHKKEI
jgi:hypothetical protein